MLGWQRAWSWGSIDGTLAAGHAASGASDGPGIGCCQQDGLRQSLEVEDMQHVAFTASATETIQISKRERARWSSTDSASTIRAVIRSGDEHCAI
jgi:hypothetical protein